VEWCIIFGRNLGYVVPESSCQCPIAPFFPISRRCCQLITGQRQRRHETRKGITNQRIFVIFPSSLLMFPKEEKWQRQMKKFIEGQAFSRLYDSAPRPPPPPLPSVSSTSDTQEDWEREINCWWKRGEGGGQGAESYDCKKYWSSINRSIISVWMSLLEFLRWICTVLS
jgi:hypothetical protein